MAVFPSKYLATDIEYDNQSAHFVWYGLGSTSTTINYTCGINSYSYVTFSYLLEQNNRRLRKHCVTYA